MNENLLSEVNEKEFYKQEIHDVDYYFDKVIKDCGDKFFPTNQYRYVYDKKFTKFANK